MRDDCCLETTKSFTKHVLGSSPPGPKLRPCVAIDSHGLERLHFLTYLFVLQYPGSILSFTKKNNVLF